MKVSKIFINGATYCFVWIILVLLTGVDNSNFPDEAQMTSFSRKLYVYIRRDPKIDVYGCRYIVKEACFIPPCVNCENGSTQFTNLHRKIYENIGDECLKALDEALEDDTPTDYLTYTENYKGRVSRAKYSFERCANHSYINRYPEGPAEVVRLAYQAQLDVSNDELITIGVSNKLKFIYSEGFGQDENNKGIMWNVMDPVKAQCYSLQQMEVTEVSNFIINQKNYTVVKIRDYYYALQLEYRTTYCSGKMWETDNHRLLVSYEPIPFTNTEGDIPGFYIQDIALSKIASPFLDKQKLYDSLAINCTDCRRNKSDPTTITMSSTKMSSTTMSSTTRMLSTTTMSSTNSRDFKGNEVQFPSTTYHYLSIFNTICLVLILLYLAYGLYKKITCSVECNVTNRKCDDFSSVAYAYGSDLYDTVVP